MIVKWCMWSWSQEIKTWMVHKGILLLRWIWSSGGRWFRLMKWSRVTLLIALALSLLRKRSEFLQCVFQFKLLNMSRLDIVEIHFFVLFFNLLKKRLFPLMLLHVVSWASFTLQWNADLFPSWVSSCISPPLTSRCSTPMILLKLLISLLSSLFFAPICGVSKSKHSSTRMQWSAVNGHDWDGDYRIYLSFVSLSEIAGHRMKFWALGSPKQDFNAKKKSSLLKMWLAHADHTVHAMPFVWPLHSQVLRFFMHCFLHIRWSPH